MSDQIKENFVDKFSEQCIARETRNSVNEAEDRKRFKKPCSCIANRMMENLTVVEAEKFLVEKKNTHSLRISFDEAAYFCLPKQQYKTPSLFKRNRQSP